VTTWTRERVLDQSASWVSPWRPPESTHTAVDGYEFYFLGSEATVMACPATLPGSGEEIRGALDAAARCGAESLQITVGPDYPGGDAALEELATMSAVTLGVADILAVDLSSSTAEIAPTPSDVEVVVVGSFEEVAAFERTSARGWGYPLPSDADIRSAYQGITPGSFLASCAGVPAGTGGFTLVEPVARLWGAAVIPEMRGRGVYRGLVASRLGAAAARGATLALVHAEPTSSPILKRLGFRKFGERRTFRVDIDS
jgi:GNAT superfamily N-acetyltransferase